MDLWLRLWIVGHISDYWPGSGVSDEAGDTGRGLGAGDPTPGTLTPALTLSEVGRKAGLVTWDLFGYQMRNNQKWIFFQSRFSESYFCKTQRTLNFDR